MLLLDWKNYLGTTNKNEINIHLFVKKYKIMTCLAHQEPIEIIINSKKWTWIRNTYEEVVQGNDKEEINL